VLDEVTYAEAAELAYNGAKVLHPRTLAPLAEKKIPVWSKNSFALEKPGTKIVPAIRWPTARARSPPWPTWRWCRSSRPARS
jgi:aspartokinase